MYVDAHISINPFAKNADFYQMPQNTTSNMASRGHNDELIKMRKNHPKGLILKN